MTPVALTAHQQRWWMAQVVHGRVPGFAVAWRCRPGTTSTDLRRWWQLAMLDDLLGRLRLIAGQPVPLLGTSGEAPVLLDAGVGDETTLANLRLRPWDLFTEAGVRASVVHGPALLLLIEAHPLVADEGTFAALLRRIAQVAAGDPAGTPLISSLTWPAPDLAEVAAWRAYLRGAPPVLDLPLVTASTTTTDTTVLRHRVTSDTTSPAAAVRLLAAVAAVCQRRSGQDDLVLGWMPGDLPATRGPLGGTWPVRLDLRDDPSAATLLGLAEGAAAHVRAHHGLPLADLLGHLALPPTNHHPLFQLLVGRAALPHSPVLGDVLLSHPAPSGCVLSVLVAPHGELLLEYPRSAGDDANARALLTQIATAFDHLATASTTRLSALPLHDEAARAAMTHSTAQVRSFPVTQCLHQVVADRCRSAPQATALIAGDAIVTYGEMDLRANRLANHLRTLGVGPDVLVGHCLPRTVEAVVAILAILKAGGAYVPLDPAHPRERLAATLIDCGATVLISDQAHGSGLSAPQTVLVDRDEAVIAACPTNEPTTAVAPQHLAYVIYTSGSTGRPKGVPITHAQVMRLFHATHAWFSFDANDVWTLFHSLAFDFSVWELWGPLLNGGRLVLVDETTQRAPAQFHALVVRAGVTVLNQTPAAFQQFARADELSGQPTRLRLVIFGGEKLELSALNNWFARHGDTHPRLVNMYGITETTVHVTYRPLRARDSERPQVSPIGEPIPDLTLHLLDSAMQPVPVGVIGELYVGGAGVGRGYLNRDELTAERFVPDPQRPGERLYRSGDAARRLPDGEIDYVGRLDQQVKIRGYRIELGEIEAVLRRTGVLADCAVTVYQASDAAADRLLVAYVVPKSADAEQAGLTTALRATAKAELPSHMVPSAVVVLERLPLTVNGKLDRRALPPPPAATASAIYVAANTGTEQAIAAVWCGVLGAARVGVEDSFFDLGGNSLRLVQVHAELERRLARSLPIIDLFQFPTVRSLARRLDAAHPVTTSNDAVAARAAAQHQALAARRRGRPL